MSRRDQDAIQAYLSDLLREAAPAAPPEMPEPPPAAPPRRAPERQPAAAAVTLQEELHALEQVKRQQLQALLDSQLAPPPPAAAPSPPETAPPQVIKAPIAPQPTVPRAEVAAEPCTPALLQWCENGRPVWAQGRFDVLLFQVAGLTLAVPLIALGQIYPLKGDLSRIFGQADWFMGLLPTPAGQIRTVNTALFVMPERYDPVFAEGVRYVISIDGLDWGLAVDKVRQPTRLQPEDVTWRTDRSKRPWLAGTVKSAMCALLDIPQMGRLLQQQDRCRATP